MHIKRTGVQVFLLKLKYHQESDMYTTVVLKHVSMLWCVQKSQKINLLCILQPAEIRFSVPKAEQKNTISILSNKTKHHVQTE